MKLAYPYNESMSQLSHVVEAAGAQSPTHADGVM